MDNKKYLNGFAHLGSLTPGKLKQILKLFANDAQTAWNSFYKWPSGILTPKSRTRVKSIINTFDIEQAWEKVLDSGIQTVSLSAPDYPYYLRQISDPPLLLYYLGNLPHHDQQLITVVGSRKISRYGQDALKYLLTPLAQAGVGIISGLAFGADAASHRIALNNKCYTLGVLASGVDQITPYSHYNLGQSMVTAGGGVLSEFPLETKAAKHHFQQRNRILAGLAGTTLVIEAAEKSGTLITVKYAVQYNRNVAVVPGSIFSLVSQGCNNLIKSGAQLISKPEELLELYNLTLAEAKTRIELGAKEQIIVDLLGQAQAETAGSCSLDVLQQSTLISSGELLTLLTRLELKGLVKKIPGQGFYLSQV